MSDPKEPVQEPEDGEASNPEQTDPPAESDPAPEQEAAKVESEPAPELQDPRAAAKAASKYRRDFRDRMIHQSREMKPDRNPEGYETR